MQVCQRPSRRTSVEGQDASLPVQIHSQSTTTPQRDTRDDALKVMIRAVAFSRAVQTPRNLIVSHHTVVFWPFATDALVGHSNPSPLSFPLHLPVTAARQALLEQDLGPVVKPVRVIGIRLLLADLADFPLSVREDEESVSSVGIHCELTCIWQEEVEELDMWNGNIYTTARDYTCFWLAGRCSDIKQVTNV